MSVVVIVDGVGELIRAPTGVATSSIAESTVELALLPMVIREAVSPGFGVLVCRIKIKSSTLGVDDLTGAGVRDGVINDLTADKNPVFFLF